MQKKLLYCKKHRLNLFEGRFVFFKSAPDKPSEDASVAKGAVEKIEGISAQMMAKIEQMTPQQAADWATGEVDNIQNDASQKLKGKNAEKFRGQISAAAEKAVAAIDRNEKNAEFDVAEKEVAARIDANLTAITKISIKDIKFHKALIDTVTGLDKRYTNIEGMEAPDRSAQKIALLSNIQSQSVDFNNRATDIINYWKGEIAEENETADKVEKLLDTKPRPVFPDPVDINRMENHKLSLENSQILYGAEFAQAGIGNQLDFSIARLHNLAQDARKLYGDTINDLGDDRGAYEKLDELKEGIVVAQEALKKEIAANGDNSQKALQLKGWVKGSTDKYVQFRDSVMNQEKILAGRNVPRREQVLNYRIAQAEGEKAPEGKPVRIAKAPASKERPRKKG